MTATVPFKQMKMRWSPAVQACDLVIDAVGNSRGRIAVDETAATALLVALLSNRRADTDDVLPPDLTPGLAGQDDGLMARRGWAGDPLLADGERLGSKFWLRERDKATDDLLSALEDDAATATGAIADYHGVDITHSARLRAEPGGQDTAIVVTTVSGTTLMTQVSTL